MNDQQTIINAKQTGLSIEFENSTERDDFLSNLKEKLLLEGENGPILETMKSVLNPDSAIANIYVRNSNDAMTTNLDIVKPALEFLDKSFPGLDFLGRVIASEATELPRSLTPGRDTGAPVDDPVSHPNPDTPNSSFSRCLLS